MTSTFYHFLFYTAGGWVTLSLATLEIILALIVWQHVRSQR